MTVKVYSHGGAISGSLMTKAGCVGDTNPWILEAMPGQLLNISLVDFRWKEVNSKDAVHYGNIIDLRTDELVAIKGAGKRQGHLYQSKGYKIQLNFGVEMAANPSFIIGYTGKSLDINEAFQVNVLSL